MKSMNYTTATNLSDFDLKSRYLYLVLFLSPLLALLLACVNYREKISRQIIFLVLVLYGFTMIYFGDSVGEAMKFTRWYDSTLNDLHIYLKSLYRSGSNVDFFQQVIMYLLSRITNNPSVYFGLICALFGLFYLTSLKQIYDQHNLTGNPNSILHFLFLSMVLSLPYISGSRWGLASWIFFYSVYHYFMFNNRRYILLAITSIFVHFSFFGPVAIFIVLIAVGRRNAIYYALIITSFVIQPLTSSSLSGIQSQSLIGVQERVSIYNNEDEVEFRQEIYQDSTWYIKYPRSMIWIYLTLGIIYARNKYRIFCKDLTMEKLYSFCLLLFALANSFLKIPSGGRFQIIYFLFATTFLIILLSRAQPKNLSLITLIGLVPMFLYFVVEIRRSFDTFNFALALPLPISFFRNISLFNT